MKQSDLSATPLQPERSLSATRIAQYATARGRCERYLRFALFKSEYDALTRRYGVIPESLSPLLAEAGSGFEREAVAELAAQSGLADLRNQRAEDLTAALQRQQPGRALHYQVPLAGHIGPIACEGIADLIEITRHDDDTVEAVVIDIKASRRESVGFRLQVAFYARLMKCANGATWRRSVRTFIVWPRRWALSGARASLISGRGFARGRLVIVAPSFVTHRRDCSAKLLAMTQMFCTSKRQRVSARRFRLNTLTPRGAG